MPSAIPAGATVALPPARMIDPRGHRFGAGLSAVALVAAFVFDVRIVVALVLLSIGVSAAFGLRWSIYGLAWRQLVRILRLGRVDLEHEYPPRFAQTLGSLALVVALAAFAAGATAIAWVFALGVAALQTLLAVTGYCLGCRLYFLRWWVPQFLTRLWTRGRDSGGGARGASSPIRYR